jgi:hypothetical protein
MNRLTVPTRIISWCLTLVVLACSAVGASVDTGQIELILMRKGEMWGPTHSEELRSYANARGLTTNQIQEVLIGMATNGLHGQDSPRLQVLRDRSVLVLRDYPGGDVARTLEVVAADSTNAALRRSAIRGVVYTATHGLLPYVSRVINNEATYSGMDRYALYEALIGRLKEGPPALTQREKTELVGVLRRQALSEKDAGAAMKLDRYLKDSDTSYKRDNERRSMIRRLAGSSAGECKKYFSAELASLESLPPSHP